MSTSLLICSVYESRRRPQTYLYVIKQEALQRVPQALLDLMGPQPRHVMDLPLRSERQLARVDAAHLRQVLLEQGYYLQMPPADDPEVAQLKQRQREVGR